MPVTSYALPWFTRKASVWRSPISLLHPIMVARLKQTYRRFYRLLYALAEATLTNYQSKQDALL
ncbi:hypothetical protein EPA93_24490 [Ktedonosporobacter rubrisoli]|uniref:Uncharacterized protein n=1 Tax=Ktedonosporobacter rubrisoli TaxID=2509675 RepID=A0A4P6JTQ3_KTERU|nr:hypothetical protein [Ktedonosporobacter rubrisoli]QBD78969.1 hypothetical protein EPA93_24490 [Ktedonosporobacter rubrisoli]